MNLLMLFKTSKTTAFSLKTNTKNTPNFFKTVTKYTSLTVSKVWVASTPKTKHSIKDAFPFLSTSTFKQWYPTCGSSNLKRVREITLNQLKITLPLIQFLFWVIIQSKTKIRLKTTIILNVYTIKIAVDWWNKSKKRIISLRFIFWSLNRFLSSWSRRSKKLNLIMLDLRRLNLKMKNCKHIIPFKTNTVRRRRFSSFREFRIANRISYCFLQVL